MIRSSGCLSRWTRTDPARLAFKSCNKGLGSCSLSTLLPFKRTTMIF